MSIFISVKFINNIDMIWKFFAFSLILLRYFFNLT